MRATIPHDVERRIAEKPVYKRHGRYAQYGAEDEEPHVMSKKEFTKRLMEDLHVQTQD